eukprot:364637-Chlamydomonas_euryale.AAC.16
MEESMLGSVKPYARHVLFQTNDGKTPRNWPYKLEQVENSLAMEVRRDPHAVVYMCVGEKVVNVRRR